MPLRFVLDENLRGPAWDLIVRHNRRSELSIDAVRVGDLAAIPLATADPNLLLWAAREERILLSEDKSTRPAISRITLRQDTDRQA